MSASSFAPLGMKVATKWISRGGRIDYPYLVVFLPERSGPLPLPVLPKCSKQADIHAVLSLGQARRSVSDTHLTLQGSPVGKVPLPWRWC